MLPPISRVSVHNKRCDVYNRGKISGSACFSQYLFTLLLLQMPIKKLYMLIEMAAQGEQGGGAEAVYLGKEKINISHFYDCLQDIVRY